MERTGHVRIAVVGAGLIGLRHADAISASETCTLSSIVDPSAHAAQAAREADVQHFASLDDLLARDRPDGILIATPNRLHAEQALACVAAGVPVLVEKPIAHSVDAAERLVEAAERAGVALLVGHHRVHSPLLRQAVEVVRSGLLGPIVAVMGSALFYKPDSYFDEAPWRREPGGGPILINLIHEIGNLRALVGEIVAVQALTSRATRGHPVEDTAAMGLRFESGALGTFLLSDTAASARSWEQTTDENPDYASSGDEDCYLIAGTFGSLAFPTLRIRYYESAAARSWWTPFRTRTLVPERADPLAHQIEHFAAVVNGETAPLVSGRDGLQNLRVTEAIRRAADTGTVVEVPTG